MNVNKCILLLCYVLLFPALEAGHLLMTYVNIVQIRVLHKRKDHQTTIT